tara:strand:- start:21 stop:365 length:345 start_codon:yes stop_codon:yes gene_type:complete
MCLEQEDNMGILKYTVAESNNLKLGQNGFDVIPEHDSTKQLPGEGSVWVALKCVAAITPGTTAYADQFCQITATVENGDALSQTFLQPGDIIYGRFNAVVNHTNSNAKLLGYRG